MGFFGFGNKSLGTYPNGVPYDKRRYNPHHPNHLPPFRNSPAYGYPADAWMTRAPYTATRGFQRPQWQNRGPGFGGLAMGGPRSIGSNAGALAGIDPPISAPAAMGASGALASRRGSLAGAGGVQGAPAGSEIVPGGTVPSLGAISTPNAAAGSRQMGRGGFGGMRGGGAIRQSVWSI